MSRYYSKRYKRKETASTKAWGGLRHETTGSTTSRQRRGVKLVKSPWGYWCEVWNGLPPGTLYWCEAWIGLPPGTLVY